MEGKEKDAVIKSKPCYQRLDPETRVTCDPGRQLEAGDTKIQ